MAVRGASSVHSRKMTVGGSNSTYGPTFFSDLLACLVGPGSGTTKSRFMAPTQFRGSNHVELASRTSPPRSKTVEDGVLPPTTLSTRPWEITQGFNRWLRLVFMCHQHPADGGWQWIGSHPSRVRVPESWHWPVAEPVERILAARRDFFRHVDVGDSPHRGQENWPWYLSLIHAGASPARRKRQRGVEFSPKQK